MSDFAGIVISARKGEYETGFQRDGQTREHVQLAKALGVRRLVVLVNKMDEVNWSQNRYEEIREGVTPFLQESGFSEGSIDFVPVSGLNGDNLKTKSAHSKWYDGPSFLDILNNMELPDRDQEGLIRVPIMQREDDDNDKVLWCGKIESGTLKIGTKLTIAPTLMPTQIIELFNAKD